MNGEREPPPLLRRDPSYRRPPASPRRRPVAPATPVAPPNPAVQRDSTEERRSWDRRTNPAVQRDSTEERRSWDRRTNPANRGRRTGSSAAPAPRHRLRWRWLVTAVLLALLLGGAGIVLAAAWLDTALQRVAVLTDYPDRPAAGRGTTWLLVGSDSRQDLTAEQRERLATGGDVGAGRTDTVLLVHLPGIGSAAPATVVSIPRDSYLPIPGYGRDKVNAAFGLGGAELLAQTVEQATGLRLDHYAEVGFAGFAVLVDELGGITLCPTEPISDPLAGLELPAGCQSLSGAAALGYVRTRATPRADLDRMTHQREFLSALLRRATSPAVWLDPRRWYTAPRATARAVTVDRGDHLWDLARLGWALRGEPVTLTVPIGEFTTSDSGDVVVWDTQNAGALFAALARDDAVPQSVLDSQP